MTIKSMVAFADSELQKLALQQERDRKLAEYYGRHIRMVGLDGKLIPLKEAEENKMLDELRRAVIEYESWREKPKDVLGMRRYPAVFEISKAQTGEFVRYIILQIIL